MTARRPGAPYPPAARRPAIIPGPRCGWPDRDCGAPRPWHEPEPGTCRPWGYHDVQCQRPSADPRQYPECGLIDRHGGPCDYRLRLRIGAS